MIFTVKPSVVLNCCLVAAGLALSSAPGWTQAALAPAGSDPSADESDPAHLNAEAIDWSVLAIDANSLTENPSARMVRATPPKTVSSDFALTSTQKSDGSGAVALRQSVSPWWDTKVGVDLNVARASASTAPMISAPLPGDLSSDRSTGVAWAAATAPGVASLWDRTTLEAKVDPFSDQTRLGTTLVKSVPLGGDAYALTLQNGFSVVQPGLVPGATHQTRSFESERSAKLSINDTGTSLIAGQSLSSADDRWLGKFGAEQKIFGDITIAGTVSRLPDGAENRSVTAGYKASW